MKQLIDHIQGKKSKLKEAIASHTKIYLDMKYWIKCRDAKNGKLNDPKVQHIYASLSNLVANGKVICPVSDTIFIETLKQLDLPKRTETSCILSEFSKSIAIESFLQRVQHEISHAFKLFGNEGNDSLSNSFNVWTKAPFILGDCIPANSILPIDSLKSFINYFWNIDIKDMFSRLPVENDPDQSSFDLTAQELNKENASHASEVTSFSKAYEVEFGGAVSVYRDLVLSEMTKKAQEIGKMPPQKTNQTIKIEKRSKNFPCLHIEAMYQATIRWDKHRKLEGNDLYDVQHAAAALPYCDAFFTEKDLAAIIKSGNSNLDKQYSCKVYSEEDEIIEYLDKLS